MYPLSGQQRYAIVLALVAVGILAVGLALKPAPRPTSRKRADVTATRAELDNLQRLVQRNSLRNMGSQFSSVADKTTEYLLPLSDSNRNAIAWEQGSILLSKRMGEMPRLVTAIDNAGQQQTSTPARWVAGMPFATAQVPQGAAVVAAPLGQPPPQGAWVVAVSVRNAGPPVFRPGVYNGRVDADCGAFVKTRALTTVALSPEMLGGGLFDLEARLVGVVAECDGGLAIVTPDEVRNALTRSASAEALGRYGMRLGDGVGPWQQNQSQGGVVITEVWRNWPADVAGLNPGDFLISIDGQPATNVETARALLAANPGPHAIQARRGPRARRISLEAAPLNASPDGTAGVLLEDPPAGIGVERVVAGSSAERAGIRSGDRILEIDGRGATRTLVAETIGPFQARGPALVLVQRGDRRMGVALTP